MLYFEDSLWMQANFWRDTIGTLYFVLGFIGISFHLILLSILPEISNFITRPSVLIWSAQFIACILQLFVVFIPVPAMIAVNRNYFLNKVMINVPPFLLVTFQCFAFIFILINAAYRNLRSSSRRLANIIFFDRVIFGLITTVSFISFYFAVNICAHTTIRRFSPSRLTWIVQDFEENSYYFLMALILLPLFVIYVFGISDLAYRNLLNKKQRDYDNEGKGISDEELPSVCVLFLYLLFDLLFAFWICLGLFSVSSTLSFVNVFMTAHWPVITSLSLDIHIRSALIFRMRGIFQPHAANTPIVIHGNKKEHGGKLSKF